MSNYLNNFLTSIAPLFLVIGINVTADQTHIILQDIAYIISILFAFYQFYKQHINKNKK